MEESSKDVTNLIWDRTLELLIKIHDCPDNPEHLDSLVHWLNEDPAHLKAFNELGQIWISTGIALAREIGQPLIDLERDQSPLMTH
ncbi:hypothetical protein LOY64_11965 [Pseudomonas corrugata]|uniref:hypothetical protein n=1 Tax=Pseudomonas corrugata TaxID=47879 RepID=UPI00222E131D|nr:hypothetical protein [Pseudomonas corrugata]UZD97675.1 hypothetical protein LOY64_11965 [Pseudomonas corrugata]